MKLIKSILFIFAVLLVLSCVYFFSVLRKIQPDIEGEIRVSGIKSPVHIIRDKYAIPHIYAENTHDLLFAQGYVTAQDRLWQMDLTRRIAGGRLSEIFGEGTVEVDYFFRVLEIKEIAERIYKNLHDETREELDSFSSGANYYLESGKKTIESVILGYEVEPWNPVDTISIHLLSAFDLSINMDEEIFAIKALKKLGEKKLRELLPVYPDRASTVLPEDIMKLNLRLEFLNGYKIAREQFGLFQGKGASNNWVVDGKRSINGRPILANDVHLRIQIPSVWHEVHLNAPGINVIGAAFPGSPYVLIGHNERVAWGFTDAMADRIDLFIEKVNPENPREYWNKDHWEKMRIKKAEIKVKGRGDNNEITREVKYTRHGPIISSFKEGIEAVLSMKWTGSMVEDQTLKGASVLNRAKNIEEARQGSDYSKIYTLNMLYADVEGNIGYQLIGGIPIRTTGKVARIPDSSHGSFRGKLPVVGWGDEYDWRGFVPGDDLPHLSNPSSHFIATANNKIVGDDFPYLLSNTWAASYRYERIVSLLKEKEKLSIEDFERMQADVYSAPARMFVGAISRVHTDSPEVKWVLKQLADWDYEVSSASVPALLYEVIKMKTVENTFKDELGELYPDFINTLNFNYNLMDKTMGTADTHWWDNINTANLESRDEIILKSIQDALSEIREKLGVEKEKWAWGRLHRYKFAHPLGEIRLLDKIFNPKSIPAGGDGDTINKSHFSYGNPYDAATVPSYRFLVDLSDIEHALAMNSTGQSGNPFSRHYSDSIEDWSRVKYHPLLFEKKQIEKEKWKELRLRPM